MTTALQSLFYSIRRRHFQQTDSPDRFSAFQYGFAQPVITISYLSHIIQDDGIFQ